MVQVKYNIYYLFFLFFIIYTLSINVLFDEVNPYFLTIPLFVYTIFNIKFFIKKISFSLYLILFSLSVSGLVNGNFTEIVYYFCFFNLFYLNNKIIIGRYFYLFLFIYTLLLYFITVSVYEFDDVRGLIPFLNNHNKIPYYSISLFENLSVTATSIFGLIFFIYGLYIKSRYRTFILLIGAYFVFFGGSRMAIILLFYSLVISFTNKKKYMYIYSILIFFLPLTILLIPNLLTYFPENLFFLINKGRINYNLLEDPRVFTAIEYIYQIEKSPIFGHGSIDFRKLFENQDLPFSELQFLLITAKNGIVFSLLFIFYFLRKLKINIDTNNKKDIMVYFTILFSFMYYGSFIFAYNFLFLLIISLLYAKE